MNTYMSVARCYCGNEKMNTYMVVVGYEGYQSDINWRTIEVEAENADEANYNVSATLSFNEWVEMIETVKIDG